MFAGHIKQTIFFSKFILLASKFSIVWTFPRKSMGKKIKENFLFSRLTKISKEKLNIIKIN